MDKSTKTAIAIGGGVVGALVIAGIWEHFAHAAPAIAPTGPLCPDGTAAPGGVIANCPAPHPGQNPYSPPNGWVYSGDPTKDFLPSVALLAASGVDPCACANVGLVRRVQAAAGLVQSGQSDGRYGPDVQRALQSGIADLASQGYDVSGLVAHPICETNGRPSWWGAVGAYTNPNCPGDPGPTYA
ncbi:MAG: hypothetical protein ACYDEA_01175 [Candidatus Dormibacteria bacterium]